MVWGHDSPNHPLQLQLSPDVISTCEDIYRAPARAAAMATSVAQRSAAFRSTVTFFISPILPVTKVLRQDNGEHGEHGKVTMTQDVLLYGLGA